MAGQLYAPNVSRKHKELSPIIRRQNSSIPNRDHNPITKKNQHNLQKNLPNRVPTNHNNKTLALQKPSPAIHIQKINMAASADSPSRDISINSNYYHYGESSMR